MSKSAHHGTFYQHTILVGGSRDEHYPVLSNGFNGGAMDLALGTAPGTEMAPRGAGASAVRELHDRLRLEPAR